jgi:hypothetical protein
MDRDLSAEDFDDWPPASHGDAGFAELEGEDTITHSGKRKTHARMILWYVRKHPAQTAPEIDYGLFTKYNVEMGETETRRRLADLKNLKLVYKRDDLRRECEVKGTKNSIWLPAVAA